MRQSLPRGVTLYFVRHGETDWNATRRYQGQADVPMNDRGRAQAARNGEALRADLPALAGYDFVASPLGRTVETMRILRSALDLPPDDFRLDERLIELHYGHWQGQLLADLATTDAENVAMRASDPFNWRPHGGESYADLVRRLAAWLATVERNTVVVSHGGVSRALRWMLVGVDDREIHTLPVPQDRVLVISGGRADWI